MINNPLAFASNNTHVTQVLSQINLALLCDANVKRRGGLIINQSRFTLHLYFGDRPPADRSDFLKLSYLGNIDIPFMYVGKIWGFWEVTDQYGATIHEFYGDFQ
jgi:hypothetical protein